MSVTPDRSSPGVSYFSFVDILKIPEFSGLRSEELLPREMDERVLPYLYLLGGNNRDTLAVQACKHRPLGSNQPIIGFRYALIEREDKQWTDDKKCSLQGRIFAQKDPDLRGDMITMSSEGIDWKSFERYSIALERKKKGGKLMIEEVEVEEEYEKDLEEMSILRDIQMSIRGTLSSDEDMIFTGDS